MFSGASNMVEGVDRAFVFIFAIAFIFIIGITAFMIWTVIKFNRKKGHKPMQFSDNVKLEVTWTVIPLILVLIMFWFGWRGFAIMRDIPDDAMRVTAIGRMWEWEFDYGDGKLSPNLVIPVDKPVVLELVSEDVNHSLFIPAFRVKEDVVPGYTNLMWFIPYNTGEFEILCTEYCGILHSGMLAKAIVVEEEEYERWIEELPSMTSAEIDPGFTLLRNTGCLACHSIDGRQLVGPSFLNYFGTNRIIVENGIERDITADEEYTIKSVFEPDSQIVKGYSRGLMMSYSGMLTEEEVLVIIEYLKTLSGEEK